MKKCGAYSRQCAPQHQGRTFSCHCTETRSVAVQSTAVYPLSPAGVTCGRRAECPLPSPGFGRGSAKSLVAGRYFHGVQGVSTGHHACSGCFRSFGAASSSGSSGRLRLLPRTSQRRLGGRGGTAYTRRFATRLMAGGGAGRRKPRHLQLCIYNHILYK